MKIGKSILVFILFSVTIASNSQVITVSFQKQNLSEALNEISKRYNLKFAFDNELTDEVIVSGKFKNKKVEDVISSLLSNTNLDYKKQGDVFILFPSPDKPLQAEKKIIKEVVRNVCIIKGIVKDKNSGENLPYATVQIPGLTTGTISNSDGFFNLILKTCDSVDVSVSYLGYVPMNYREKPNNNPFPRTVFMNAETELLKEIEIIYEVKIIDNTIKEDAFCTRLNLNKAANVPSLSELDIIAPVQKVSGIDGTTETTAGLEIRKSAPDKNLIIYDGFNIYQIDHFFGSFSSINSKLVKDIKVYKNIPEAKYGGRTSGIVEITGKSGNMYKPVFDIGADMLAVDAKIEIPVVKEKLSFIAAGRRSYTDFYQSPVYVSMFKDIRYDYDEYYNQITFNNRETDPGFRFYDFGSKLTWRPAEKQVFSLSYHEASDILSLELDNELPSVNESSNNTARGAGLRWSGLVTKLWESEITLGYSFTHMLFDYEDSRITHYQRQRISFTDTTDRNYELNSNLEDFTGGFNNRLQINSNNRIEAGFQANYFMSDYHENITLAFNRRTFGDTTRNYNNSSFLSTPYIQHIFNNEKWNIKSGIRLGYFTLIEKLKPEFRLSASYSVNDKIMLKAMAGNYYQYTNKVDLIDRGDFRSTWILSDNETFPVVKSYQASAGVNYNISKTFNIDVELYQKQNDGLVTIQYIYSGGANDNINQEFVIYNYNSLIRGADIMINKSFRKLQSWLAYTLSRSVSQGDKINEGDPFSSDNDQLHELKVFNSLTLKNWDLSLSWIFGSGKPWDNPAYTTGYRLTADYEKNSERLPAYHRMDAGINYNYKGEKASFKIGVNIFNVYNRENIIDRFITLKSNPVREVLNGNSVFETTEIKGFGFTPNVFINFSF